MNFNDSFYERKADASTIALRIQFLEDAEDPIAKAWINADAIVADKKNWLTIQFPALADLDLRFWSFTHELGRILKQILEYFQQTFMVPIDSRQIIGDLD